MTLRSVAIGFVLGVVALGTLRAVAVPPPPVVHHHANVAVFLEGQRFDFSSDRYMEDVASCYGGDGSNPRDRVHFHENNPDVVHVHAPGATWGHLFQNVGWSLGPTHLLTDDGRRFFHGEGGDLVFVLNGLPVDRVEDRVVASGDRLLVSFGASPLEAVVREEYAQVASNAPEYNLKPDPASCSGAGHEEHGVTDRLRRGFWR
jgi:hypothetical protein